MVDENGGNINISGLGWHSAGTGSGTLIYPITLLPTYSNVVHVVEFECKLHWIDQHDATRIYVVQLGTDNVLLATGMLGGKSRAQLLRIVFTRAMCMHL